MPSLHHIALGYTEAFADTFGAIYQQVECEPEVFLNLLADYPADEEFTAMWWQKEFELTEGLDSRLAAQPLLSTFAFMGSRSCGMDVFISNGSAIRHAQQCHWESDWVDCNRGVSGIDGSTSTALGSSMISGRPTLLITGDMSADYDIGVLLNCDIPDNFKILILDNGGADIFRNIGTTGSLPERDSFFVLPRRMPYRGICANFGGVFFEMTPGVEDNIEDTLARFLSCVGPAMAVMHINPEISKNLL